MADMVMLMPGIAGGDEGCLGVCKCGATNNNVESSIVYSRATNNDMKLLIVDRWRCEVVQMVRWSECQCMQLETVQGQLTVVDITLLGYKAISSMVLMLIVLWPH